jgi:hypothetical protein
MPLIISLLSFCCHRLVVIILSLSLSSLSRRLHLVVILLLVVSLSIVVLLLIDVSLFVVISPAPLPLVLQCLLSTGAFDVSSFDKARPQAVVIEAQPTMSGGSSKLGRPS